jgi:hypothetical protein
VQQELVEQIHRTAVWPVVVTVTIDGEIRQPEKTDFIDRDGSHIILIPNEHIYNFMIELNALAQLATDFPRFWKSEARFVVAGTYHFSASQQTEIFEQFSLYRIYNCIIVSREHYTIDRQYSIQTNGNDVDTGTKLAVYTWFPYQSPDRCDNVNDIMLLDSWVIAAQGHFTRNTDLFPRKIGNSFNGCPMKAVVRNSYSSFTTVCDYNQIVDKQNCGLEIDLLMTVLKQLNMTPLYVPTTQGFGIENGHTDKLTGVMFIKGAYIALGAVGTKMLEDLYYESTNAHVVMSVSWHVPCPVKYPRWSSIFRILSVELWLVLIILIVGVAISTTLLARYSCTSEWQGYKTLTSSLTNIWSVILGVGVTMMPRAPALRLMFLAWVFFSLAFNTAFQAFLTTFLTDSGYKKPFKNMNEVSAAGISSFYSPEYNFLFENVDETVQIMPWQYHKIYESINWVSVHKNMSLFFDDLWIESYNYWGNFSGGYSEPVMCKLEDDLVYDKRHSMVMIHGDPLLRRVSEIIDRVVEAGLYNHWISVHMNTFILRSQKIALVHPLDEYYSFSLYHMQTAFYLLLMGWCLSFLCFMVELLYSRLLSKRK